MRRDTLITEKMGLSNYKEYARLVEDAYDKAEVFDPKAKPAWDALEASTEKLFKRVSGKVKVIFTPDDPYPDAPTMVKEVKDTGVMKIYSGDSDHPIWSVDHNLKFRAVHDYITHIGTGAPFGLRGELRAYNTHARLVPQKAKPAIFTEVVGQVCSAIVNGGRFPIQKVAILEGFDYDTVGKVDGYEIDDKKQLVKAQPTTVPLAAVNESVAHVMQEMVIGVPPALHFLLGD